MQARKVLFRDIPLINKWLQKHNHAPIDYGTSPAIGYIVPGVAVGFLRKCEGYVGLFDGLATNPLVSKSARNRALNAIYSSILKEPGFNTIIGWTLDASAFDRAVQQGFTPLPHALLAHTKA